MNSHIEGCGRHSFNCLEATIEPPTRRLYRRRIQPGAPTWLGWMLGSVVSLSGDDKLSPLNPSPGRFGPNAQLSFQPCVLEQTPVESGSPA